MWGLAIYLLICLVMYLAQGWLLYAPSAEYDYTPQDLGMKYEQVTLSTADQERIVAWWVPHQGATATVLFCHGNAGNISDRLSTVCTFHRMGYQVLIFDYRGYGQSTGRPCEQGIYLDAEAAWRYLTDTRGIPPNRIVVFGRSLGGGVAIELARRHPPAALMVESTFTSVADIGQQQYPFLPVRLLCRHPYSSIDKVPLLTCPKLFLHSCDDELIPLANGKRLFETASEPKRFIETPGEHDTGGFEYSTKTIATTAEWLSRTLSAEGRKGVRSHLRGSEVKRQRPEASCKDEAA